MGQSCGGASSPAVYELQPINNGGLHLGTQKKMLDRSARKRRRARHEPED
jgi:hypothetical protein